MPLPATRHPMPDVGAAGAQGSRVDPCAHPKVGGLLWRGEPGQREVYSLHGREVRCPDVRGVPEEAAAASLARQAHGCRAGQRQIPPCRVAGTLAAEIPPGAHAALFAAVQPAAGAHRARLEARAPNGDAQPLLRYVGRTARRHRAMLRSLATSQFRSASAMRHYLRRYV